MTYEEDTTWLGFGRKGYPYDMMKEWEKMLLL